MHHIQLLLIFAIICSIFIFFINFSSTIPRQVHVTSDYRTHSDSGDYFASVNLSKDITARYRLLSTDSNDSTSSDGPPSLWVREYYAKQASARKNLLRNVDSTIYGSLYNVIVPEARCPDLVRVGNLADGGKYVCNPKAFPTKRCSIYSLGLANEISFDLEIQKLTGYRCNLYGYDNTEQSNITIRQYEKAKGKITLITIADVGDGIKTSTVEQLFKLNNDDTAEVLKMDIEGAEFFTLIPFISKYKVCQILLEIHGGPVDQLKLLVSIAKNGYALFSIEVNYFTTGACEYAFIHVDCMKRYGAVELKRFLHEVPV